MCIRDRLNMEDKEATPVEEIEIITRKDPEKQPEETTQTEGEKTQEMFKCMMECIKPVSYTHLDVYKRQEFDKKINFVKLLGVFYISLMITY